ncbi:MAG: cold shock domain-containing protein [Elusimicrobiota bacterium]|nr:MAG: cold shock domain-containing protein [Elusimicrobiota bacterium]
MQGRVKSIDKQGVGWITADDGSGDYFFHLMVVNRESEPIGVGDPVVFERKPGKKGNFAVNIWKLENPGLWQVVRDQTYEQRIPDLNDPADPQWPLSSTSPAWDEIRERRRASAGDPQPDAMSPLKGYSTTPQDASGLIPPANSKSDDLGQGFSPQEFDHSRTSPDQHWSGNNELVTQEPAPSPQPLVGPIQYAWMRRRKRQL